MSSADVLIVLVPWVDLFQRWAIVSFVFLLQLSVQILIVFYIKRKIFLLLSDVVFWIWVYISL